MLHTNGAAICLRQRFIEQRALMWRAPASSSAFAEMPACIASAECAAAITRDHRVQRVAKHLYDSFELIRRCALEIGRKREDRIAFQCLGPRRRQFQDHGPSIPLARLAREMPLLLQRDERL